MYLSVCTIYPSVCTIYLSVYIIYPSVYIIYLSVYTIYVLYHPSISIFHVSIFYIIYLYFIYFIYVSIYIFYRLIRNPPKSLTISPSRKATTSSAISYIISQITSSEPQTSAKALSQIEQIVAEQRPLLLSHVDQLLRAILMQKRITFTTQLSSASTPEGYTEILNTSRTLASILVQVFSDESLAKKVHQETLVELERDIFGYLIDEKLLCLESIAQLNRVYNVLMGHIVENTDKNAIFG